MIAELPLLYVLMAAGFALMVFGLWRERRTLAVVGAVLIAFANTAPTITRQANEFGHGVAAGFRDGRQAR